MHEVAGYTVDPAALQRCDTLLAAAADHSRAALTRLHECVAELLGTGWHGWAASAYRLGWEQWFDGMTAMLDALHHMALAIGSSGAGYAETDEAVRTGLARATT